MTNSANVTSTQERANPASISDVGGKALYLNLDNQRYGTVCEIGAGQRVANQFFKVGAAAGTIAKTMSAYDMSISDEVYGKAARYVCQERIDQMLNKEYQLTQSRLQEQRGDHTTFFTYAATIKAKSYNQNNYCHGYIGLRFQHEPNAEPSEIQLHVHMLDDNAEQQAQALGMLGVNLIFGGFYFWKEPKQIIATLLDELSDNRLEIDFIEFSGAAFKNVENRLMNLQLIRNGCTRAVLFDESGRSQIPCERLRKKPVMTIRGSFRPPTKVNIDMFNAGKQSFANLRHIPSEDILTIAELTTVEVGKESKSSDLDFLARADLLSSLGHCVLVSDYHRFFSLRSWLRTHTKEPFAITLSVRDIKNLLAPKYYTDLEGGMLEAMGKLFPDDTHVFVYPSIIEDNYVTLNDVQLDNRQQSLLNYLIDNRLLVDCPVLNRDNLSISSKVIHEMMQTKQGDWRCWVDPRVVEQIDSKGMFSYSLDEEKQKAS